MNIREQCVNLKETNVEFKKIETLDKIPVDIEIEDVIVNKKDGETFKIFQCVIDGFKVRVPYIVLLQLKIQLQEKNFDYFKVIKSGQGMDTRYTVITL
jgi:hypothetical protein